MIKYLKYLCFSLMFVTTVSFADRYEQHMKLSQYGQCIEVGRIHIDGMRAANRGKTLMFNADTQQWEGTLAEHVHKTFREHPEFGASYSERDKEFYFKEVKRGMDKMIAIYKRHNTGPGAYPDAIVIRNAMQSLNQSCKGAPRVVPTPKKEVPIPEPGEVNFIKTQSEPLVQEDSTRNYWGFERRIQGCYNNMGKVFHRCKMNYKKPPVKGVTSEADIFRLLREYKMKMSISCNIVAVEDYFDCLGPRPSENKELFPFTLEDESD